MHTIRLTNELLQRFHLVQLLGLLGCHVRSVLQQEEMQVQLGLVPAEHFGERRWASSERESERERASEKEREREREGEVLPGGAYTGTETRTIQALFDLPLLFNDTVATSKQVSAPHRSPDESSSHPPCRPPAPAARPLKASMSFPGSEGPRTACPERRQRLRRWWRVGRLRERD